ncbi:hypothetical protein DFH09DRAFT_1374783 [Mycena vulgaris]|nr:hypothetical protein DFH09DRAFT_1374783 [Mycena vulgaris]
MSIVECVGLSIASFSSAFSLPSSSSRLAPPSTYYLMPASSSFCGHCTGTAALRSMTLLPLSCCDVAAHDDTTIKANDIRWAAHAPLSCEEHGYVRDWPRRLTAFTADSMSATSPARPTVTAIRGKPVSAPNLAAERAPRLRLDEHRHRLGGPTINAAEVDSLDFLRLHRRERGPLFDGDLGCQTHQLDARTSLLEMASPSPATLFVMLTASRTQHFNAQRKVANTANNGKILNHR